MATERFMQEAMAELQEQNFESIDEINEFMNKRLNTPAPKKYNVEQRTGPGINL